MLGKPCLVSYFTGERQKLELVRNSSQVTETVTKARQGASSVYSSLA